MAAGSSSTPTSASISAQPKRLEARARGSHRMHWVRITMQTSAIGMLGHNKKCPNDTAGSQYERARFVALPASLRCRYINSFDAMRPRATLTAAMNPPRVSVASKCLALVTGCLLAACSGGGGGSPDAAGAAGTTGGGGGGAGGTVGSGGTAGSNAGRG